MLSYNADKKLNIYSLGCNKELMLKIKTNLQNFKPNTHEIKNNRQAAVAITIIDSGYGACMYGISPNKKWSKEPAIILTQRSAGLKNHAGQWALPGGRIDNNETFEEAALRELKEEVGLKLSKNNILGRLDDFTTRSGFVITPVIIWGGYVAKLIPNPDEVESIHRIPIAELLRKDSPIIQKIPGSKNPILLLPIGNSWIAAPTAALIYQFREVAILGLNKRVAHYEQPFFAWK